MTNTSEFQRIPANSSEFQRIPANDYIVLSVELQGNYLAIVTVCECKNGGPVAPR